MEVLILKLGATGDVVRTTPLLKMLSARFTWLTASKNITLLQGLTQGLECLSWEDRGVVAGKRYDLVINLEDTCDVASFLNEISYRQLFGAFVNGAGEMRYTDDSCAWFDLSLISRFGRKEADQLKLLNRRSYQDLLFSGLGLEFNGQPYLLPQPVETGLCGDVAISAEAGPVWPMKNWAYYSELKAELEAQGLRVNVLGKRPSLLEHLADVSNHRCLVSGDSLPMHFALGSGLKCVSLFTCTSPWEIYGYGIQTKIVSPHLEEFFYQRSFDRRATTAISVEEVLGATLSQLDSVRALTPGGRLPGPHLVASLQNSAAIQRTVAPGAAA